MAAHDATYEFRAFDVNLEAIAARWAPLAKSVSEQLTTETYLITRLNVDVGVKIRNGQLEVKELDAREGLLELWRLRLSEPMPVSGSLIARVIAPLLGVDLAIRDTAEVNAAALAELASGLPALGWLTLTKQRTQFLFDGGHTEIVSIEVGDVKLQTAAVEGHDPKWALEAIGVGGIETKDNESYPSRLQRLAFLS